MRKISKSLIITLALAIGVTTLAGCSVQQKVGDAANTLVSNYCTKPVEERVLVRSWIDKETTPNKIRLICAVDVVNAQQAEVTTE